MKIASFLFYASVGSSSETQNKQLKRDDEERPSKVVIILFYCIDY